MMIAISKPLVWEIFKVCRQVFVSARVSSFRDFSISSLVESAVLEIFESGLKAADKCCVRELIRRLILFLVQSHFLGAYIVGNVEVFSMILPQFLSPPSKNRVLSRQRTSFRPSFKEQLLVYFFLWSVFSYIGRWFRPCVSFSWLFVDLLRVNVKQRSRETKCIIESIDHVFTTKRKFHRRFLSSYTMIDSNTR